MIHDSVWDTDYVASLAIVLETLEDDTTLENVVFRDIEIYRELGRAVLVNIHKRNAEECTVDVLFENITIGTGTGAVDMKFDAKNQANSLTATLNQVSIDDHLLTKDNIAEHAEILGGATVNFP